MPSATSDQKDLLRLRQMEMSLVRAHLEHPDLVSQADYQALRYILNFARLEVA